MRIINVVPYYPPHIGGMEICAKEISEHLSQLDHEVTVYTSKKSISSLKAPKYIGPSNLKIFYLRTIEGKTQFPIFIPSLIFKLFRSTNSNTIVHVHCSIAYDGDFVPIISKIKGFKAVIHLHQDPINTNPIKSLLINIYKNSIWRLSFLFADKIICPSKEYVKIAAKYGAKKDKCIVIPNGINLNGCYLREMNKFPNNLLFVGRLKKEKNVIRLI